MLLRACVLDTLHPGGAQLRAPHTQAARTRVLVNIRQLTEGGARVCQREHQLPQLGSLRSNFACYTPGRGVPCSSAESGATEGTRS
jgi:hypothetical protein